MSRTWLATVLFAAGTLCASAVEAQEAGIRWHVMGGFSEPVGNTSNYLQGGYLLGGGFTITPSRYSPFDFRVDLSYSNHNVSSGLINASEQATNLPIDFGTSEFISGTANVEYHLPIAYGVNAYGIAGIGAYHARVELDQVVPYGFGYYYCDPFYGYCGPDAAVVASSNVTKFGWNAGLGVEFKLPFGQSWFVETRFHRINTSTPIEFVPITVGYRF